MARDSMISGTATVVRVLAVLNVAAGVGFAAALLVSWPAGTLLMARLLAKYHDPTVAFAGLTGIRLVLVIGLIAVWAVYRLFTALAAILASLRSGDPFLPDNAARVRTIAWAMLALQVLDTALGGLEFWLASLHIDVLTWTPSVGGWLSVLVAFVLAHVFARGAAMRDDLVGTV
ncbi:DUF2975 domain-containing protein [Sphingomonas sp. BAUL-RG-20F-R05-02]|uniref:DUF2975 domain-containing protein n=1 Tax=Sphingomonas sp. BAUL-RG-20F-R05-02 TaxID=2914830 RepID=UPI001F59B72E|nr:DUF2975 domain-containing protein [Sphingomonas sp. BAUL-RG-20F-R05-02]